MSSFHPTSFKIEKSVFNLAMLSETFDIFAWLPLILPTIRSPTNKVSFVNTFKLPISDLITSKFPDCRILFLKTLNFSPFVNLDWFWVTKNWG